MDMIQLASERLWVFPSPKPYNYFTGNIQSSKELRDACNRYFILKSSFISTMKEIAGELDKIIMNFLNAEILSKTWNYKAGPGKWSKKEIIGHLIDSAQINLQRFVRSTYSENFSLTYDQVEWVNAQQYISADIEELLQLWRLLNRQIIRVLENYPTHRLQVQSDTGKTNVSFHTVEHLAQDYLNHLNHHLKAIELE